MDPGYFLFRCILSYLAINMTEYAVILLQEFNKLYFNDIKVQSLEYYSEGDKKELLVLNSPLLNLSQLIVPTCQRGNSAGTVFQVLKRRYQEFIQEGYIYKVFIT